MPTASDERSRQPVAPNRSITRWLALGAVAGAVLFTFAYAILGQLQPGYSFVSRPISALAIGPYGTFMQVIWLLTGLLLLASVIASPSTWRALSPVSRWIVAILLLLPAVGILWTGVFTM